MLRNDPKLSGSVGAAVLLENCWFDGREYHPYKEKEPVQPSPSAEHQAMWSDDPRIWHRLR